MDHDGQAQRVQRARRRPRRRGRAEGRGARGRQVAPRTPTSCKLRRAVPDPSASPGPDDADGRQRAGLHGAGPDPQATTSSSSRVSTARRRPRSPRCGRSDRLAGAVPPEAGARPDQRAEHGRPPTSSSRPPSSSSCRAAAINQQAASSTVDIAKLQAAFDNVFATMDAVDTFRAQAVDSMAQTVTALEGQIERAKPYLERTRRGERQLIRLISDAAVRRGTTAASVDAGREPSTRTSRRGDSPAALTAQLFGLNGALHQRHSGRSAAGRAVVDGAPGHRHPVASHRHLRGPAAGRLRRRLGQGHPGGLPADDAAPLPGPGRQRGRHRRARRAGRRASRCSSSSRHLQLSADAVLDAARNQDVDALMSQGTFLRTKFSGSDLDL